jgi:cytochrome c oxidase subunit III
MPARVVDEIELIVEEIRHGGGAPPPPPPDRRDGGDAGDSRRRSAQPSGRRHQTAIVLAIASILMFFFTLAGAFLVRRTGNDWVAVRLPWLIWVNTLVLLASSATLELSVRRLRAGGLTGFEALWKATTGLGLLFIAGQLVVWRNLAASGVYVASNPGSSFFYIFTAAHAVHLVGGIAALLYVLFRKRDTAKLSRSTAVQITSYYWHFMGALWIFLLALLYFGK